MDLIKDLLENDYLLRKLMDAKINSEGVRLSHTEVCRILGSVLAGAAFDEITHSLCFDREYEVKHKKSVF